MNAVASRDCATTPLEDCFKHRSAELAKQCNVSLPKRISYESVQFLGSPCTPGGRRVARGRLARGCTVYRTIAEDRGRASRKRRSNSTAREGETDRGRKRETGLYDRGGVAQTFACRPVN